ncbi:porin [Shewanella sairae]|uniref:Porin n=1 Tax=Shewanella sairae TaxID=190310 RepID=A0ABQ4PRU1_9GAMM|nr:OmpA family protein [Shewanella sairae]MCL1132636.1 outer membrane beta-barrel protein [Shewanella sairae]GIU52538.1 porin [Shewanella sairae]
MKKSLLAIALLGNSAYANTIDVDNTWYLGAGVGQSSYESVNAISHLGTDRDLAWNATVGFQFNEYFALEAGWQDLGATDDTHQWGNLDGSQSIDVDGFTLGLVGTLPLSEKWFLTGEGGAYQYHLAHQINANKYVSTIDTAPYFGAGIGYKITDALEVSAKYRRFTNIDETTWNTANMDVQTVGIQMVYRFGVKATPKPVVSLPVVTETVEEVIEEPIQQPVYETKIEENSYVVLFDFDSSSLNDAAKAKLNEVIQLSKQHDSNAIVLIGQSDNQGSSAYNQKLSEQRTKQVGDYLTTNGVNAQSLEGQAMGEQDSKANSKSDRALERRVVIKLTSETQVMVP